MNAKRFLAFAIAVFSLVGALGFTPPASAGVRIGIGIGLPVFFPPPPLRREVVYARPGPGYTWVNGYWDWRPAIRNYAWVGGRWVLPGFRDSFWVAAEQNGPRLPTVISFRREPRSCSNVCPISGPISAPTAAS